MKKRCVSTNTLTAVQYKLITSLGMLIIHITFSHMLNNIHKIICKMIYQFDVKDFEKKIYF